jgi:hypothetical protein
MLARVHPQRGWTSMTSVHLSRARAILLFAGHAGSASAPRPGVASNRRIDWYIAPTVAVQTNPAMMRTAVMSARRFMIS